ncbi:MAG: radical SAM protein [Candidatus Omnitrophota bacterium]
MDIKRCLLLCGNILASKLDRSLNKPFRLPYRIKIFLTHACNCRCKHCGIWKIYQSNPLKRKEELSISCWERLLYKLGKNLSILSISGGEPFLREDLKDLIILASKHCKSLFAININTNGTLPEQVRDSTASILKSVRKNIKLQVSISCDGSEQAHDYSRGVNGSYAKVVRTIKALSDLKSRYRNLEILKNMTISSENIEEAGSFLKQAREEKIKFMTSFVLESGHFNYDKTSNLAASCIPRPKILETLKLIDKAIPCWDPRWLIQKIYIRLSRRYFKSPPKQVLPCYSSWSSVGIDPYGNVLPCIMWPVILGSLKDNNFELDKILKGATTQRVRQAIKQKECPACWDPNDAYITILQNLPF